MHNLKLFVTAILISLAFACGESHEPKQAAYLVEHACSAQCEGEEHFLAHGEKGHKCTPECKRIREKKS